MHLISFSPPASPASSASPAYPPHKIALLPYEHVTEDVWYEKDTETGDRIDVKYTDDILDQMIEDDEEDDESSDD